MGSGPTTISGVEWSSWDITTDGGTYEDQGSPEGDVGRVAPCGRLCFQRDRPGGQGSNDIYVARRDDTDDAFGWAPAVNLGPDVNTTAAEVAPWYQQRDADGPTLYFARGPSNVFTDIYSVPITRHG